MPRSAAPFRWTRSIRQNQFNIDPYISLGSWDTTWKALASIPARFNSSGTSAVINVQNSMSDGYLTYAGQRRQSVFAKVVQPLGENTTLTFAGMWNNINQYVPLGATKAQIARVRRELCVEQRPEQSSLLPL